MERATKTLLLPRLAAALVGLIAVSARADAQEEARCIEASARYNRLPPALLYAVREQEGGRSGGWHTNADGSVDYGVMQINSRWLPLVALKGYTATVLTYDACSSIAAGAWILAQALAHRQVWDRAAPDAVVYWRAVGEYHSRTPGLNRAYAERVWRRYQRLVFQE